ncbi:hypothetical protein [Blastochloris sulfoviridis]|uniref:Uncharacterized protein n=1 Tax=Blastochloris sulfoviridis TaxID=50712 RepID=A0A5M6HRJ6_9HYPH|nr:hypothetical protein [Blastochloris sulfoviridis]KAA5598139.1 hypothetical protein F1193_13900 [Blastochloris sulfoviridis]
MSLRSNAQPLSPSASPAFAGLSASPAFAGLLADLVMKPAAPTTGGYAFETAMCLVESQSPLARPAFGGLSAHLAATIEEREAQTLLLRTRMLARLLAGVRDTLDAADTRTLFKAAARVAGELMAVFGPSAVRVAADGSHAPVDRAAAATALTEGRLLAEGIAVALDRLGRLPCAPCLAPRQAGTACARKLS